MEMKQNETINVPGEVTEARFSKRYWSKLHREIGRQELVVLDMSAVTVLEQTGLKAFAKFLRKMDKRGTVIRITRPTNELHALLELLQFDWIAPIIATTDASTTTSHMSEAQANFIEAVMPEIGELAEASATESPQDVAT